ncbi:hypothetical protein AVEN_121138-1 [Araneus ventricosus]|uniref:Uncharacterized protein n=1 Tax=Araneus ventricosus TaxID=182803 RepID=A0A4Y2E1Y4_ARAVE|nr:hypothetical protein AVEN_121138-1 [Araneus ventricosus]
MCKSLGPPTVKGVGEMQWQSPTADRFFAGVGTCASSNCSLHATNGMWSTGLKSINTNRCVCKGPSSRFGRSNYYSSEFNIQGQVTSCVARNGQPIRCL